ncbi:tyrosine-type recombinase/integrase [Aetokthonos hydrillicola Thurmond2011]|jgi:integrase/recombinase XerD|uniref:Tyrosine-type recombinase/integrase n=1 Tax=Aetokthonos hydrillicola Thurmond2011 TaxID=2712845 RepID=A0AAP5M9S7_9CYAN|nr:tyrosine-type recombinase/integrase [Aetokthonos hydrillicola]MBO3464252.1 tyrosine-type recombinase/integrase [Aetokthonos hydrillicola CCALA 1050]MBW4591220.1 tyrosine-type recombinase/integrase [Aetokthonos hydrillicola CCALA 1050]MDR9900471.1 tyrosine-type recombinase/integrase [Aetokthonos hydrillicola Thurmond2011]
MLNSPATLTNSELIDLWLHGKSPNTVDGYRRYAERFSRHIEYKPLSDVTLMDIQMWTMTLGGKDNSKRVAVGAIKSLFSFAKELGVISSNLGILVKTPSARNRLAERILTEDEVQRVIGNTTNERDRTLIRLLYFAGLRVSELCALKWRDLKPRGDAGQITVFGKGEKTRTVLVGAGIWRSLLELKNNARKDDPVFVSSKGGHLCRSMVFHIVKDAAKRAGLEGNVSPHWLRHSHASHSLDRGAPIHLLQKTLGHSSVAITEMYLHARPTDSSGLYLQDDE